MSALVFLCVMSFVDVLAPFVRMFMILCMRIRTLVTVTLACVKNVLAQLTIDTLCTFVRRCASSSVCLYVDGFYDSACVSSVI